MSSHCRTCSDRDIARQIDTSIPSLLKVCLITLSFENPVNTTDTDSYLALNHFLNDINDSTDAPLHPASFTSWSPCLSDPRVVVIITTAGDTWPNGAIPIESSIFDYLTTAPKVQHIFLDQSICSIGGAFPDDRIACEMFKLQAPNSEAASAIGERFGWPSRHNALSEQMDIGSSTAFSRPGDLIADFSAWVEPPAITRISSSDSSESEPELRRVDSDSTCVDFAAGDEHGNWRAQVDGDAQECPQERTLVMLFQWKSYADAKRFKSPGQKSYGRDSEQVDQVFWDKNLAHPVRQLAQHGVQVQSLKLEFRGVEERLQAEEFATRRKRRSARLSMMATELGTKFGSLWKRDSSP